MAINRLISNEIGNGKTKGKKNVIFKMEGLDHELKGPVAKSNFLLSILDFQILPRKRIQGYPTFKNIVG